MMDEIFQSAGAEAVNYPYPRQGSEVGFVEPERCHVQRLLEGRSFGGQRHNSATLGDAFRLVERQVRHAIAPETTMTGFPARPKARPTGRLIFEALSRLVLVPARANGPPIVPAPPELATRILDLLEVDPTTTR